MNIIPTPSHFFYITTSSSSDPRINFGLCLSFPLGYWYSIVAWRNWSRSAHANAAITQIIYRMIYLSEPNSKNFNLLLCNVFSDMSALFHICLVCVNQISKTWIRLRESDFQNRWFSSFFFFLSVGVWARVSFFLLNLDVVGHKKQRWKLYILYGLGVAFEFLQFARVLQINC